MYAFQSLAISLDLCWSSATRFLFWFMGGTVLPVVTRSLEKNSSSLFPLYLTAVLCDRWHTETWSFPRLELPLLSAAASRFLVLSCALWTALPAGLPQELLSMSLGLLCKCLKTTLFPISSRTSGRERLWWARNYVAHYKIPIPFKPAIATMKEITEVDWKISRCQKSTL